MYWPLLCWIQLECFKTIAAKYDSYLSWFNLIHLHPCGRSSYRVIVTLCQAGSENVYKTVVTGTGIPSQKRYNAQRHQGTLLVFGNL